MLKEIQKTIFYNKHFILNHRYMKTISNSALLILTAEIERCITIKGIGVRGNKKYFPKDEYIKTLLKKIGYWEYFNISFNIGKTVDHSQLLYLKIVSSTLLDSELIGTLISFFEKYVEFDGDTRDYFSDAMLEAAANAVEFAYDYEGLLPKTKGIQKWWLTATINKSLHEVSFVFYDQGIGILRTVKSKRNDLKFKSYMSNLIGAGCTDEEILKILVTTDLSSHKDKRRGNGLVSFKKFIDSVDNGELIIYTDNISYAAIANKKSKYNDFIDGTLIEWKIRLDRNSKGIRLK